MKNEELYNWNTFSEPEPAMTDCWAQGSVPRIVSPSTPRSENLEDIAEEDGARYYLVTL